jgi:very-short-patch-repair endonuclease
MRRAGSPPRDAAIAELAIRQWGVVSVQQLHALGLTSAALTRRVQAGRLHRLYRGVYAVGHDRLRREGRFLAAVFAGGDGAVLSHLSAAVHWGLLQTDRAGVDVTAPRTRTGAPGIRLHTSRSLGARDTTTHDGMPITTLARTLLDLAATIPSSRLERALAQAERLRIYDHRAIKDVIARTNGHRGRSILARATAREPRLTRSELEVRFLKLVRRAGLPEPLSNLELEVPDHGREDVDFYWPAHRLVVETDGWETHGTRSAFQSDRRKDAALTAAGYSVMRFTYDDVTLEGATVVRRLRR